MTKYWIWRIITNDIPYQKPRFQWREFELPPIAMSALEALDEELLDGETPGNWALVKEK